MLLKFKMLMINCLTAYFYEHIHVYHLFLNIGIKGTSVDGLNSQYATLIFHYGIMAR